MKILQVTDMHITGPGLGLYAFDPRARLAAAVADINKHHGDAALCLFTGDLTDNGAPDAFAVLRDVLADLSIPYRLLLGNHDHRQNFLSVFPEAECDASGFVQARVTLEDVELLLLDTHEPKQGAGTYCAKRCAWLRESLAACGDRPVYIFMHHPTFDVGLPCMDRIKLSDDAAFQDIVAEAKNLRHIFFGHLHRPVSGSWHGIPFSGVRSTVHQVPLDLRDRDEVPYSGAAPQYAVIFLEAAQTTVHLHDFLTEVELPGTVERYPVLA